MTKLLTELEKKEQTFHDEWAKATEIANILVKETFEAEVSPENRWILSQMGDLRDKKVLELGCGLGEASVYLASRGALVTATDISEQMIEKTKQLARYYGAVVDAKVVSANSLENIQDNYYDFTYAGNLLHHVDIDSCVRNLRDKLRPGGISFFWDPIAYNPLINIYRKIATKVRTEDEHPLTVKDIRLIRGMFKKSEVRYFWLSSLSIFLWYFIVKRHDPNKVRYWKQILVDSQNLSPMLKFMNKLDQLIFRVLPFTKYFAWNVVIKAQK